MTGLHGRRHQLARPRLVDPERIRHLAHPGRFPAPLGGLDDIQHIERGAPGTGAPACRSARRASVRRAALRRRATMARSIAATSASIAATAVSGAPAVPSRSASCIRTLLALAPPP